jgi:hypothetical protein
MANSVQILDKLSRHLTMLGVTHTRGAANIVVNTLTITYADAVIEKPMGGMDVGSPFLGIGIANPGMIVATATASDTGANADTFAEFITASGLTSMAPLSLLFNFGNTVKLVHDNTNGGGTDYLEYVRPNPDLINVGM